ncbi:hypothetical protein NEUTE2DRAFT_145055 [Neurospora tetrasperma FGSC 2509]|nr:hypothetical protein NEUTE2DRAFT_145055 [Neurospora tetrasperma FGSC 2509]
MHLSVWRDNGVADYRSDPTYSWDNVVGHMLLLTLFVCCDDEATWLFNRPYD